MQIVYGSRSPYRMEKRQETEVVKKLVDGVNEEGEMVKVEVDDFVTHDFEVQVADYRIVVCHDSKCPGLDKKGHLLEEGDRSHHHDYRFLTDARPEEEIIAEVLALEEAEKQPTEIPLKI